jgi:hypothetical protein
MICEILSNEIKHVICEINGCKLQVSEDGVVFRFNKKNEPIIVKNTANSKGKYNEINCNNKGIKRHRIIGYCFLNLDINNHKSHVDHINGDKIDNHVINLRVVTNQQNHFNMTKAKGYYFDKHDNRYKAQIHLNGEKIYLGCYKMEEEARSAYLAAKLVYHKIN